MEFVGDEDFTFSILKSLKPGGNICQISLLHGEYPGCFT